eukprot:CAMPEP_0114546708 /NCGR_PEP_ID=MMETSP0114-20121206/4076_1 /TAXON_ID=31324 /ORGANISM="Goniomonas sp, Strain m" /LENGTH=278 /DNA_ID=CAMNT_0001731217 /DNA_START=130 /DNA_END=966 /DNA_ORIENTATION=+
MPRVHLWEWHDLPQTPDTLRLWVTEILQKLWSLPSFVSPSLLSTRLGLPAYRSSAPRLAEALRSTKSDSIIDLCSGSGGPLPFVQAELDKLGVRVNIELSDLVPNVIAFQMRQQDCPCGPERLSFISSSVDATKCKKKGFRTMYACLHHFRPDMVQSILQDAVDSNSGIAIFEGTERSLFNICFLYPILVPIATLLLVPFQRPFSWMRLFFTYVVPVLPAVLGHDGLVSCLRTYSPKEMQAIIAKVNGSERFTWSLGVDRFLLGPNQVYYIGVPKRQD